MVLARAPPHVLPKRFEDVVKNVTPWHLKVWAAECIWEIHTGTRVRVDARVSPGITSQTQSVEGGN